MDMRELELLVPTLFGLEGLCAEELRRLKLPEVAAGERALLPHGVRAHLWPYRRQEAQAV